MSESQELVYSPFFLHCFLDEYISSEKGSNSINTLRAFKKYLPTTLYSNLNYDEYINNESLNISKLCKRIEQSQSQSQSSGVHTNISDYFSNKYELNKNNYDFKFTTKN